MDTILFHNTMRIRDGHRSQFDAAVRRAVAFVEGNGPRSGIVGGATVRPPLTGFTRFASVSGR